MDTQNKETKLDLISEILTAYSDCNGHHGERNLNYISSSPLTAIELIKLMPSVVPEGYNEFDSIKSTQAVVKVFGEHAEYFIAREGSVCIYIKPKHNLWFNGARACKLQNLKADEIIFCPTKLMFRIWWD